MLIMLYARNRDSFKKTTERVEYKTAAKSIIQSLKSKLQGENSEVNAPCLPPKRKAKPTLLIHRLFDVQIDSTEKCVQAMKAYISVLQSQVQSRKETVNTGKPNDACTQCQEVSAEHEWRCYFAESQRIVSRMALCLFDNNKAMGEQEEVKECLREAERLMSTYQSVLEKGVHFRNETVQYLAGLVDYYEKTIHYLKRDRPVNQITLHRDNLKYAHDRNTLMQIEINRLTEERTVINITNQKLWEDNQKLSQKCEGILSALSSKKEGVDCGVQWASEIKKYSNDDLEWYKLKNEKEYLQDKCAQLQQELQKKDKEIREISSRVRAISLEKDKEIREMSSHVRTISLEKEMIKENLITHSDQNTLLQERVRLLQASLKDNHQTHKKGTQQLKQNTQSKSPMSMLNSPPKQQPTLQSILRWMNKPATKPYYKCILKAIESYETRIAAIRTHYIEERGIKEAILQWGTSLYNNYSEKGMEQFTKILNQITMTPLDRHLRSIKCLSLGVDACEIKNMQDELSHYVLTLQKRLPALEECFEEGSSVNDFQEQFIVSNDE